MFPTEHSTKQHYVLSQIELWFLLSQSEDATVIGFRNPMTGWLREDMFPLIQEATYSLISKKIINTDVNGEIKLHKSVEEIVQVLTNAHHTILVGNRLMNEKKETTRSFHFAGKLASLMEELPNESYLLKSIEETDEIQSLIIEPLSDKMFWAPDTDQFYLSQDDLLLLYKSVEDANFDDANEHLARGNGDDRSKTHFLDTLQRPVVRLSFVGFYDRNDPTRNRVDGFSMIAGERYLWVLEIVDDENKITRISKISMKDLNRKLNLLIPSVL